MASKVQRAVDTMNGVLSLTTSVEFWKYMLLSRPDKVRRLAAYLVAIATLFGATSFYLFAVNPKALIRIIIWLNRRRCRLIAKQVLDSTGFRFSYAERSRPSGNALSTRGQALPTLILVPGLGGTIDNWVPVVKAMSSSSLHIIAVELPGGGATSCDPSRDLHILGQVERLRQFLKLAWLDRRPVHLVGAATGGTVVGCYAAMYPEHVVKLTLICPAFRTPVDSDTVLLRKKLGRDPGLVPRSANDIPVMFQLLSSKQRNVAKQLMKGMFELKKPGLEHVNKLAESMFDEIWNGEEDILLTPRIGQIQAPTHVIWGRYDRVIHMSGAELLKERLPNCVAVDILPCGHSIFMDDPRTLANLIERFTTKAV